MSLRTLLFFLLAISSGLIAAAGVTQMRSQRASKQMTSVIVVKKGILRGTSINAGSLVLKDLPVELYDKRYAKSIEEVVGRVATATMIEGEFVMVAKLSTNKADAGMAALIPDGMRAKGITAINLADRVSGLIETGDHVDILLTRSVPKDSDGLSGMSETILQNVEVLAVDRILQSKSSKSVSASTNRQDPKSSSLTVLVTPEQASLLNLAQREGILSFSLRNPEDHTIIDDSSQENRFTQLVSRKHQSINAGFALENLDAGEEDNPELQNTQDSVGLDFLEFADSTKDVSSKRLSAIRTIRGSRLGIVPISN
jgi:pilus assembly protein CpaB